MTSAPGFPLETVYEITDISQGFPGVVTLLEVERDYAFSVAEGQTITIHNVEGMFQLNEERFIVTHFDSGAKTFELYDLYGHPVDTTNYTTYIAEGEIDIISYPGTPPGLMYNNQ